VIAGFNNNGDVIDAVMVTYVCANETLMIDADWLDDRHWLHAHIVNYRAMSDDSVAVTPHQPGDTASLYARDIIEVSICDSVTIEPDAETMLPAVTIDDTPVVQPADSGSGFIHVYWPRQADASDARDLLLQVNAYEDEVDFQENQLEQDAADLDALITRLRGGDSTAILNRILGDANKSLATHALGANLLRIV